MSGPVVPFIPISPITKVKTIVYSKMQVIVENISVGENQATIKVCLWSELQDELREFTYTMKDTNYTAWTTDDFLIDWVKGKLKFETF